MDTITVIGYFAGLLTTLSFLPQVVKAWRSRSTADISTAMFVTLCAGIVLWLIYGFLRADGPLIVSNAITLSLAGSILALKLRHDGAPKPGL